MAGELLITFLVQRNILFPFLYRTNDLLVPGMPQKLRLQPETVGSILYILVFSRTEIAFGETEVINGVQQVCLAGTIMPGDPHDPPGKVEYPVGIILKLGKRYF
jgi:hypothetical protein